MIKFIFFVQLLFIAVWQNLSAQSFAWDTARILQLSEKLYDKDLTDSSKYVVNNKITELLKPLLSARYDTALFDSLTFLKHIAPQDDKFKMITWAFPTTDSGFHYSGLIRITGSNISGDTIITLDTKEKTPAANRSYPPDSWPGAVYYKLSENTWKKEHFYTLLGWMGSKPGETQRVIEIIKLDGDTLPVFGAPVIVGEEGNLQCRMLFRFTDAVPFHLQFEKNAIPGKTKKKVDMVVFNELTGNNPQMGRIFRAPVPDYSAFDALVFKKGKWYLYKDLDLRIDTKHLNNKSSRHPERRIH